MKKVLISILTILCAFSMIFGIVGCGDNAHTHTFSGSWSSDDTYHWKAATCEHTSEVSDKEEHTFDEGLINADETSIVYTCSVCGKTKLEPIVPPYYGLGGKIDFDYKDKTTNQTTSAIFQVIAGLTKGEFNVDFVGSGNGDIGSGALFVRNSKLYLGSQNKEVLIGDISELQSKLSDFDFTLYDPVEILNSSFNEMGVNADSAEVMKDVVALLENEAFINMFKGLVSGGLKYVNVTAKQEGDNTLTTIDLNKTIIDVLNQVKQVTSYIDENYSDDLTVKGLYNSDSFKALISFALSDINAKDIQSVITGVKNVYDNFDLGEFPINIIDAGNMSTYEYLGQYLDAKIQTADGEFAFGDMPLSVLFPNDTSAPLNLTAVIEGSISYVNQILPTFTISVLTKGTDVEAGNVLSAKLNLEINQYDYYYEDWTNIKHAQEINFTYNEDVLSGITYKINHDEPYSKQNILLSLLISENGIELTFKDDDCENYEATLTASANVEYDNDGDFSKFIIDFEYAEKNFGIKTLEVVGDYSITAEYEGSNESKNITDFDVVISVDGTQNSESMIDFDANINVDFTYANNLLTKCELEAGVSNVTADSEPVMFNYNCSIELTYNADELLTNVKIDMGIPDSYLNVDIAYVDGSDKVASVKINDSGNDDTFVIETKYSYDNLGEVSQIELIVNFIQPGAIDEFEPYNATINAKIKPIISNEEVVGLKGDLSVDFSDFELMGEFELETFTEPATFINLENLVYELFEYQGEVA